MPRVFFDMRDGSHVLTDPEGLDFVSLKEARKSALVSLAEMAKDLFEVDRLNGILGRLCPRIRLRRCTDGQGDHTRLMLAASTALRERTGHSGTL